MKNEIKKLRNVEPLIESETNNLHNVLDESDVQDFKKLKNELRDTWTKKQMFRTQTEMEFSVLNDAKHPNNASKYWQCVREQNVFLENLMTLSFDYRQDEIKLKRFRIKLAKETDELNIEAKDRMREIRLWSEFKKKYDDGLFDSQNVDTHQLEAYGTILKNRKDTLTGNETQPELINVLGQVDSLEKLTKKGSVLTHETKKALPDSDK